MNSTNISRRSLRVCQKFHHIRTILSSTKARSQLFVPKSQETAANLSAPVDSSTDEAHNIENLTKFTFKTDEGVKGGRLAFTSSSRSSYPIIHGSRYGYHCRAVSHQKRTFCSSSSDEESGRSSQSSRKTYDAEEVDKFSKLSEDWWNEYGEFQALHSLNSLRVPLVREGLCGDDHSPRPLNGLKIADVGCGGGILSEPLARLGAEVTGIDASLNNVEAAARHAKRDPRLEVKITYKCCLVEELAEEVGPTFDGLVASEIVEHVADPRTFVKACCDLVVPGGSLFFTTMNRTKVAYGLAVFAAERIFRIVPAGAHDWNKFISPEELTDLLRQNGAETRLIHGMILNPLTLRWSWCSDTNMNYALHAVKDGHKS